MRHGSLFSGIGGFDLAAEWMGWLNVFHCEKMEFPRQILKYYWPEAESFKDICETDFTKYANSIDVLTGGFPCQPFSHAGKRKGTSDERFLWAEMLRAIHEINPQYIIAENVLGITNIDGGMVFEQVCLDVEAAGYHVQPFVIPAASKNAPHRRERVFFIAKNAVRGGCIYPQIKKENIEAGKFRKPGAGNKQRLCVQNAKPANTYRNGCNQRHRENEIEPGKTRLHAFHDVKQGGFKQPKPNYWGGFPTQSPICGGDDGIPSKLDGITFYKWRQESIKGYGNAIVPQVAFEIFKSLIFD